MAVLDGDRVAIAGAVVVVLLALYLAVIYAAYIVVVADVGPLSVIALSWRTVRAAFLPSALVLLAVTLLGEATSGLLGESVNGGLSRAAQATGSGETLQAQRSRLRVIRSMLQSSASAADR